MDFKEKKFVLVKNVVSEELCKIATKYALLKKEIHYSPENIENRENTHAVYSDTLIESILWYLLPIIEKETNLQLYPTYSFYRVYNPGDILEPHYDRCECEISATLCLGVNYVTQYSEYNWDMYVRSNNFLEKPVCKPGDMIIYKGQEVEHWRDKFDVQDGSYQVQAFLHYVDKNGPYANKKYDRRPGLGYPITSRLNLQQAGLQ